MELLLLCLPSWFRQHYFKLFQARGIESRGTDPAGQSTECLPSVGMVRVELSAPRRPPPEEGEQNREGPAEVQEEERRIAGPDLLLGIHLPLLPPSFFFLSHFRILYPLSPAHIPAPVNPPTVAVPPAVATTTS